jgi:hypothetical protein
MKSIRYVSSFALAAIAVASQAQADPQVVQRIINEGKNHNQVMSTLTTITKKLGPRLTGSMRLNRAEQWAMDQFRRYGCTNVHLEKWGEVPVGFERGPVQVAKMVEPYNVDMVFTTSSWTNGTKGIVTAEAMYAPKTLAEFEQVKDQLVGKWIVMPATTGGFRGPNSQNAAPSEADKVSAELDKLNIAGRIRGSRNELVITGGTWNNKTYENHPGQVSVLVRKSDMDRIVRNLDWKRKVVLAIGADNRFIKGPIVQSNVVAEIRGTEKPDEVVIVSGHFDSWDGPGSEGASDNGTGSAAVLESARILNAVGARPKRTIRFILWTGEEQGLYGSREYVKQHANEMDKISAVLVDDGGSNYQGGYVILESMKPVFEPAIAPMLAAFPDFPQVLRVVPTMPRGGGSDHASFNAVGVPGFFTIETGKQDYNYVHHTQHDHLGNVIPEYMVQSSTNHAVVAYTLACAETMLPRGPKPAAPAGGQSN